MIHVSSSYSVFPIILLASTMQQLVLVVWTKTLMIMNCLDAQLDEELSLSDMIQYMLIYFIVYLGWSILWVLSCMLNFDLMHNHHIGCCWRRQLRCCSLQPFLFLFWWRFFWVLIFYYPISMCFGVLLDVIRVLGLFLRFPLFMSIFSLFVHLSSLYTSRICANKKGYLLLFSHSAWFLEV
jgi:hypothetical protein